MLPVLIYIRILYFPNESINWSIWIDKSFNIISSTVDKSNLKELLIDNKIDFDNKTILNQ